jgi:hypothetical protein
MPTTPDANRPAAEASDGHAGRKLPWRTPVAEELPFTRTEASGVGGVYDFTVYSGST